MALQKIGFSFAGLSPRHSQQLTSVGAGAAGGALFGGEDNRLGGALGGAALGLSLGNLKGPNAASRQPRVRPIAAVKSTEAAAKNIPQNLRLSRSSAEYAPGGMHPISKTQFHPSEAGASAYPPGFGRDSLPPEAQMAMPPSAHVTGHSLPPSANAEIPSALAMRSDAAPEMRPIARKETATGEIPSTSPESGIHTRLDPFEGHLPPQTIPPIPKAPRMPTDLTQTESMLPTGRPPQATRFVSPSLLGNLARRP